ncbi:hypothetical protein RQP54_17870 [Curvibacter sp. APW13]|uniref:hypothetical protein n=1 Tax=Curvibacter sp. APW13 TaxID=3077236 RepID=UPI0028E03711|nr:hypothetical protein [Curvibacter sp. APW13]MDT8992745.1 hypothetical protein [Curvibacter sp. APW13]
MSQHVFEAADGQIVLAGYDRMCGEYFYSVFANSDAEAPSAESRTAPKTIDELRTNVDALVGGVPAPMFASIREDAINNMGNRVVKWAADGSIISDSAACGRKVA